MKTIKTIFTDIMFLMGMFLGASLLATGLDTKIIPHDVLPFGSLGLMFFLLVIWQVIANIRRASKNG